MPNFSESAAMQVEALISGLETSESGISTSEANIRAQKFGLNEVKSNKTSALAILVRQFRSPFVFLLFGAFLISIFLGEATDAFFILFFVFVSALLGFYQEYKSNNAVNILSKMIESKALVFRDKILVNIPSSQLIPGDIIELKAGDIVQADARLISSNSFFVDESILTGEVEPQYKNEKTLPQKPLSYFDAKNIVFSGTTVVSGTAKCLVFATGRNKVVGQIANKVLTLERASSFEKGINRFSGFILKVVFITLALMVIGNILVKGGNVHVPSLLLFSVALAVSVIPEALPVVITYSLSKGAMILAKRKVIVKRLSSIEELGSITVLCTDKTGTITQNKLTLTKSLSYRGRDVRLLASLGSQFEAANHENIDSFDKAILRLGLINESGAKIVDQVPFDPIHRTSSQLVSYKQKFYLITRGAPENVFKHTKKILKAKKVNEWMENEGKLGSRILAVSYKVFDSKPKNLSKSISGSMSFAGLLSFDDPLKESTLSAMHKARKLGIRLVMITGDRKEVAGAVGKQVGLIEDPVNVMDGANYLALSDVAKDHAVSDYNVFSRATPDIKHDIIQRLQKTSEVGFLGEGINDAPALKMANVGIVVDSASGVSREAADIIILQKSLLTVIEGVEEGRKVFGNTVKYIKATLTSNFGNFYAVAISSLFIPFLPLLPVQILLVNLLSDFPMISIATDSLDPEELKNPRSYDIKEVASYSLALGVVSTFFDFLVFGLFVNMGEKVLQTNWFIESILTELVLIYSIRSNKVFWKAKTPSMSIFILTGVAALITIVLPQLKLGADLLGFYKPSVVSVGWLLLIALTYFICTELAKLALVRLRAKGSLFVSSK